MAKYPTRGAEGGAGGPRRDGFTLIESMVVAIIISVLAVIAIPSVVNQMRDRRTRELSEKVMLTYRDARMRAMGRGAAVLVRFDKRTVETGTIEVREGIEGLAAVTDRGVAAGCATLPAGGCLTNNWNTVADNNRRISLLDPSIRGEYANMELAIDADVVDHSFVDLCFSPLGASFIRFSEVLPFTRMVDVPTVRIWRKSPGGDPIGLERSVLVLPTGVARIAL